MELRERKVWAALAVAATAALVCVLPAGIGAAAPSYLMQASATFQRLGPFWISDEPSYQGAIDALGPSSSCHLVNSAPNHVTAAWRALGVRVELVTFGGVPAGETGCTAPAQIHVSTVRVTGKRWYTSLGLRVGDSAARLRKLYPRAKATAGVAGWYRRGYWLVTRRAICLGDCGGTMYETAPVLVAETANGRVTSIVFVVGAQGD